jgi:hypothetical protein
MNCSRCGELVPYHGDWPGCPMRIPMTSIKAAWARDHRAWRLHEDIYRLDHKRS